MWSERGSGRRTGSWRGYFSRRTVLRDAALAGRVAVDLVRSSGAQLHIVHAWQAEIRRAYEVTLPVTLKEWCQQRAAGLLAKEVRRIEEAGGEVTEAHLVMGPPVDAILELCEELDPALVIMGRRGLGRWTHLRRQRLRGRRPPRQQPRLGGTRRGLGLACTQGDRRD